MLEGDVSAVAVGKRLKRLRQMAGLSREGLAHEANVGRSSITFWERAKAKHPMTPRSMAKILAAIQANGIVSDSRWLLTGIGITPHPISTTEIGTASIFEPIQSGIISPQKFIAVLDEELKLFTSLSENTVIMKIETACMLPAFEKGDMVGGIWQSSETLHEEKICIIEIANQLQVRKIKRSAQENHFHVSYLRYDPTLAHDPFEIDNLLLTKLAPVIRLWRYSSS